MLSAAAEGRLKLPAEILAVRMAEQKFRQRTRIGRDIECFVLANARIRASGDVADRVSASLASRDVCGRQAAHEPGRVADLNIVQLKILAAGPVRNAPAIPLPHLPPGPSYP